VSRVAEALRTYEVDVTQLHQAARSHEEVLQKLIANSEGVNAAVASIQTGSVGREDSIAQSKQVRFPSVLLVSFGFRFFPPSSLLLVFVLVSD
jgi:hypothetical protein